MHKSRLTDSGGPRLVWAHRRPHRLQGRLRTSEEPDLACGLVHEHAEASANSRTLTLRLQQERREWRVVNEVHHELARPEERGVDPSDDGALARAFPGWSIGPLGVF